MNLKEFQELPDGSEVEMRDHVEWVRYVKRADGSFSCSSSRGVTRYIGQSWASAGQIRLVDPLVLLAETNTP